MEYVQAVYGFNLVIKKNKTVQLSITVILSISSVSGSDYSVKTLEFKNKTTTSLIFAII